MSCTLWPWTLHFRQRVLNHIAVHRTALARRLLPAQLWQSDGKSPAVFCGREALLCPRPSPAAPRSGDTERELQGCTLIQIYTVFPRMKANPSAAAAFLRGIPHPLLRTARAEGRAWSGVIPLSCGTRAQADQRIPQGLRVALPGDCSGFK